MSLARTRIALRLLAVMALAAPAAGCFQPMYAEHTDGSPALREKLMGIEIPPVADKSNASREARIGVEIRNALAFKLYGNATGMPPTHRLILRFSSSRSSLIVDPNTGLPTSENSGIDAQYTLCPLPRPARRRRPRGKRDRRKHPDAARRVLHGGNLALDPDPEGRVSAKWVPVFPRDKRVAFARRSRAKNKCPLWSRFAEKT
jgi:hypothetical protein